MLGKIFVVDDCKDLTNTLTDYFHHVGYSVDTEHTRNKAEQKLLFQQYDICLLDLDLPDNQGFDFLIELNKNFGEMPVIILTGRTSEDEKVLGLELGADDYLTKPLQLRELQARIRVVLRRQSKHKKNSLKTEDEHRSAVPIYDFLGYKFDLINRTILQKNQIVVSLTHSEAVALKLLMEAKGRPVSRDAMLQQKSSDLAQANNRSVDITITRLRQKLVSIYEGNLIDTVYGKGYRLRAFESNHTIDE